MVIPRAFGVNIGGNGIDGFGRGDVLREFRNGLNRFRRASLGPSELP
jgi:hypothetical protein